MSSVVATVDRVHSESDSLIDTMWEMPSSAGDSLVLDTATDLDAAAEERVGLLGSRRRIATALRLLVLASVVLMGLASAPTYPTAFWLMTLAYGVAIAIPLLMEERGQTTNLSGWVVFLIDVVAVSAIIVFRGHDIQDLLVASFTLMLLAGVIDGLGNVFVNVLLVSLAYVALTKWGAPASELLSFSNLSQLTLFCVVGVLMGYTADVARQQTEARTSAEKKRRRVQSALKKTKKNLRHSESQLAAAQDSLRANERLYTIGMLSAGISHEIRIPIAVIVASAEAAGEIAGELEIDKTSSDSVEAQEDMVMALQECQTACDHLHRIVDDLNNLARARTVMTSSVDVGKTLESAARLLKRVASEASVHIVLDAHPTPEAQADPGRLMQVVLNLAKNAIDAMRPTGGGTLCLGCRPVDEECVALMVADNGPGIPSYVQECMFDPFITTKEPGEGTGLGLHLVQEIVKSHQGTIECESTEGEGTIFTAYLPIASEPEFDV